MKFLIYYAERSLHLLPWRSQPRKRTLKKYNPAPGILPLPRLPIAFQRKIIALVMVFDVAIGLRDESRVAISANLDVKKNCP
jgi:hypothetical protein